MSKRLLDSSSYESVARSKVIARNLQSAVFLLIVFLLTPNFVWGDDPPSTQWYRGNLHTHSLWSDGDDFPEMIVRWYQSNAYDFLALTDHNILSEGEKWVDIEEVRRRGGQNAIDKYEKSFDADWIVKRTRTIELTAKEKQKNEQAETVETTKEVTEYRLKTLEEFRSLYESDNKFLLIQAEEVSDRSEKLPVHLNAINLQTLIQPVGGSTVLEAIQNNNRVTAEQEQKANQPMLMQLNHPNFGWAVSAEDLANATNNRFLEIYNGHPGINFLGDETRPGVERLWDIANTIRMGELGSEPIMGTATDDSHKYHSERGSITGRGWVMVRAKDLSAKLLIESMKAGDFYCSSGVTLKDMRFDKNSKTLKLEIEAQEGATYKTEFIGTRKDYDKTSSPRIGVDQKPIRATRVYSKDIGMVLATDDSLTPTYQFKGDELYVRAVVTSSIDHPRPSLKDQKEKAWTQPVR